MVMKFTTASNPILLRRPNPIHDTQAIENLLKTENTKQKCCYIVGNSRDTSTV